MMFDVELPLRIISCGGISAQTQIRGEKNRAETVAARRERENSRAASKSRCHSALIFKVTVHMHHYDKKKERKKEGGGMVARENEIINRDGKEIDLCIYYVEKQHKQALCEVDKQAATKLLSASWATNLCVVAYRDATIDRVKKKATFKNTINYVHL